MQKEPSGAPGLPGSHIQYVWTSDEFLFSSQPPLAVGGEFRGPMGKFPKQPGTDILGVCLLTHGHNVYSGLWGCLCQNYAWTPLHGLLHPRGTGKITLFFFYYVHFNGDLYLLLPTSLDFVFCTGSK